MAPKRVLLGHVAGAHGIRGDVILKSYASDPANIARYGPLSTEDGARAFKISIVRVTPKGVVARLSGVSDRNAAEACRGLALYVARDRLPPPNEREFYHVDLIGLQATTLAGEILGDIIAVQNFGAGDLLEIRMAASATTELVPFDDVHVPDIDFASSRATIKLPELVEAEDTAPTATAPDANQ